MPRAEVIQIFDRDLFAEKELLPLFESLLGIQGIKPFECVGTNEEMLLALWMTIQKNQKDSAPVLQRFRNKVLPYMKDSDFLILKKKLLSGE